MTLTISRARRKLQERVRMVLAQIIKKEHCRVKTQDKERKAINAFNETNH